MELLEKIKSAAVALQQQTISHRRHLHANPELSFEEENTANYILEQLRLLGLEPKRMAVTGVTAEIKGLKKSTPEDLTIALRADIDALPIREQNDKPYRSKNEGVMHACGHDAHTASLLTTAKILCDIREALVERSG